MLADAFSSLAAMAHLQGLSSFEYSDDRGESWMEIRPPTSAIIQTSIYGCKTHSIRLLINYNLDYWMASLDQCVGSGSFHSSTIRGGLNLNVAQAVLDIVANSTRLGRDRNTTGHDALKSTWCRLVENRSASSTQCLSPPLLHSSSSAEIQIL